jgi:putative copper resistance protein D
VIALVAALGVVVPALHDAIVWPFAHTLSFDRLSQSAWMQLGVVAAGTVACIAALALLAGVLARPQKLRGFAGAGLVGALAIYVWLLLVPAHSTTYLVSPVPYAAEAIAAGSRLYMENCSSCHGFDGRGNVEEIASPANATVNIDVNLNDITRRRRAGDLFWSIAHGIPSTAMPGFKEQLAEPDIWNLIQYLDAQTAAHNALSLSDRLKPVLPVPAPEFTFEFPHKFTEENPNEYPGGQQESLWQQRGTRIPLLVFYTLPSSLPRLRELAALANGYAQAGAMVIAIPMSASGASPGAAAPPDLPGTGVPIFAATRPSVATTYALFARQKQDARPETVRHVEYLVDRFGSLRARWIGVPAATSAWSVNMLRQIDVLAHEPPRPPVQWGHRH